MIISHKYKMIFIKIRKVAGTSFEMAFSKYCGADDIITPIAINKTPKKQKKVGYNKGQNYTPPYEYRLLDGKTISTEPPEFREHFSAEKIKKLVPEEIWNNYLKVSIIRCPYDTLISHYYWHYCRFPKRISDDFRNFAAEYGINRILDNYNKLHINGKSVTDFIVRFENFGEDIKKLEMDIGCNGLLESFKNINAKSSFRPKKISIHKIYSEYPTVKVALDETLNKNLNRYELLKKYWPFYKSRLEVTLE